MKHDHQMQKLLKSITCGWISHNIPGEWVIIMTHDLTGGSFYDPIESWEIHLHTGVSWEDNNMSVDLLVADTTTQLQDIYYKFWGKVKYEQGFFDLRKEWLTEKLIKELNFKFAELLKIQRNNLWILHKDSENGFIRSIANQYLTKQLNSKRDS